MTSRIRTIGRAGAAILTCVIATAGAAGAADAPPSAPVLTYQQRFDQSIGTKTVSGTDYLQIDVLGDVRGVAFAAPTPASARPAALSTSPQSAGPAVDLASSCYRLSSGLLPTALQLSPGMGARGGTLDVSLGDARASVPIDFAATALTPEIERVLVFADASAPVRFTGAFDLKGDVVLASTFTVSAAGDAQHPGHSTTCRMNLMVPTAAPLKTTSV